MAIWQGHQCCPKIVEKTISHVWWFSIYSCNCREIPQQANHSCYTSIQTIGFVYLLTETYDRLYSTIPLSLVVIDLLHTQSGKITFKSMEMQKQKGNSACGVYAIAVATAVCYQEDPTVIRWNTESMRRHLLKCLEQSKMEPFPRIPDETSKKGKIKKLWLVQYIVFVVVDIREMKLWSNAALAAYGTTKSVYKFRKMT